MRAPAAWQGDPCRHSRAEPRRRSAATRRKDPGPPSRAVRRQGAYVIRPKDGKYALVAVFDYEVDVVGVYLVAEYVAYRSLHSDELEEMAPSEEVVYIDVNRRDGLAMADELGAVAVCMHDADTVGMTTGEPLEVEYVA